MSEALFSPGDLVTLDTVKARDSRYGVLIVWEHREFSDRSGDVLFTEHPFSAKMKGDEVGIVLSSDNDAVYVCFRGGIGWDRPQFDDSPLLKKSTRGHQ